MSKICIIAEFLSLVHPKGEILKTLRVTFAEILFVCILIPPIISGSDYD
ncbi:hypothetical protein [Anabaena sp. WFMT]